MDDEIKFDNTDLAHIYVNSQGLTPKEIGVFMGLNDWKKQLVIAEWEERYEDCAKLKMIIDSFEKEEAA